MAKRPAKTPKWLKAARTAGRDRPKAPKPDWIGRALPRAGLLPPVEAEQAIRDGRVRIGRRTVHEPLSPVPLDEPVYFDGVEVQLRDLPTRVLAFHKPAGVVSAGSDRQKRETVFDRLARVLTKEHARYGWHAVGRLDVDTTGLLLFTNDERLVEHATTPETHLEKRYVAHVNGKLDDARLEPLRQGMELSDGPARPAKAEILGPGVVALTLTEGRNHQVKRMLGDVGLPVTRLHREAIGGIRCDIPEGAYRELTAEEIREGLGWQKGGQA